MGSAERVGRRASFNRGNGISEIEGKGAMGSAERVGRRASFKSGTEAKGFLCPCPPQDGLAVASFPYLGS
jgi:hypothetical protein